MLWVAIVNDNIYDVIKLRDYASFEWGEIIENSAGTMTDEELREIAWDFRQGILGARGSPEGMCFAVSAPLVSLLNLYGVEAELASSDHTGNPDSNFYEHFWIRLGDGRVLDPTFDQFCSEEPVPVYIGPPTEFHGQ